VQQPKVDVQEVVEPVSQQEQINENVRETSNSMIEVLSKSDNPKHRNSKFLRFLKKLSTGAYTIENEQLVKQPEKLADFKVMEAERIKDEAQREKLLSAVEEEKGGDERQKMFERLWNNEDNLDEEKFNEMMKLWEQENMDGQFEDKFMNEWGKQWQHEVPEAAQNVIPFSPDNKYLESAERLALSKQLIEDGKAQEAIVCLQAEV
jgi:hypothetical protein